jgi:hypothetical protein
MIVSNLASPLAVPSEKQAVFHKMGAQFETRIRISLFTKFGAGQGWGYGKAAGWKNANLAGLIP